MDITHLDPDDIDPTTGLPRLPEEYFWEVNSYTVLGVLLLQVSLRTKGFFGIPRTVCSDETMEERKTPHADLVRYLARRMIIDAIESQEREAELKSVLGTYPPKNLPLA